MFDHESGTRPAPPRAGSSTALGRERLPVAPAAPRPASLATGVLESFLSALADYDGRALPDGERIDQIALLERVKQAAAAAQARITVAFADSQRERARQRGVPTARQGRGIAEQVALARRESPHRGGQHVGLARALTEMPRTMEALSAGLTTEWRATMMARETGALSREDRIAVDVEVGPRLGDLGDRETAAQARAAGYRLDPHSLVHRIGRAQAARTVSVRPAPDTMSYLTGLLPVAQGVAVYAALRQHAEGARAAGDHRSLGQLMADALVTRVTGLERPDRVPVEVHLVMTDHALLGRDDAPAHLVGEGVPTQVIPAWLARRAVRAADQAWVRRLFTRPGSDALVAADSRRRRFGDQQRRFLIVRDRFCRTPWCGAPIRHADHVTDAAEGGSTSFDNGQGLCEQCNHAKQAAAWRSLADDLSRGGHRVVLTTPTGHQYQSRAPDPPGSGDLVRSAEFYLRQVVLEHASVP